ncbi:MAG: C4-dicarboxylate transporter DctA, partial [Mesorhizobium sp.]
SECRALTNFIGNAVATVVVARWEGELDQTRFAAAMAGDLPEEADLSLPGLQAA